MSRRLPGRALVWREPLATPSAGLTCHSGFLYSKRSAMIHAGVGQSTNASTTQATTDAVHTALAQAGIAKADAALVFFSVEHATREFESAETVRRATGTASDGSTMAA